MSNQFNTVIQDYAFRMETIPALLMLFFIAITLAYFIGSISFGLILTKIFAKQDIRDIGSGNIGATNVLRTGNIILATSTLFLDVFKGGGVPFLAFWMAKYECAHAGFPNCFIAFPQQFRIFFLTIGLAAVIGHCYPIWLKFKGGKGVATAFGVLVVAVPWVGLVAALTWAVSFFAFRTSSLAALMASGIAPLLTFFIYGFAPAVVTLLITALIFWRHRGNIGRLLAGTEPRIGTKKEKD